VKAGVGLVLTGGPFDGVTGNGFLVNIERTYVGYGPGDGASPLVLIQWLRGMILDGCRSSTAVGIRYGGRCDGAGREVGSGRR
jgi:hypothetical protein